MAEILLVELEAGLVLLEAMAAELPCVVTRVGAVPDVIDDGQNGYLVEVGTVEQLGNRLAAVLAVSVAANLVPAARAASVAPTIALRSE